MLWCAARKEAAKTACWCVRATDNRIAVIRGACGFEPHQAPAALPSGVFFCAIFVFVCVVDAKRLRAVSGWRNLLVEGLGVGGGGRDVGVTGGLVGAGGELELVGRLEVGVAGGAVGGGVVLEVEEKGEHLSGACERCQPGFYSRAREFAQKFDGFGTLPNPEILGLYYWARVFGQRNTAKAFQGV